MNLNETEIVEIIDRSLAEEFELDADAMSPEASIYEDLGLDSLDTVDMVIVLQNAFGIKIRDEQAIREIRTLGDIHAFVVRKVRELGQAA